MGTAVTGLLHMGVKYYLRNAASVPEINKDQIPEIAPAVYPPHENGLFSHMISPEAAAIMGTFPVP